MEIKFLILMALVLALLLFWLAPKIAGVRKLKMSLSVFYGINVIGILAGAAGLILTLWLKSEVMSNHYFEILLFPVFLSYLFLALLFRIRGEDAVLDEKQNLNMMQAAASTFVAIIVFCFFLYAYDQTGQFVGLIFPVHSVFSILVFSAFTIYYYKRISGFHSEKLKKLKKTSHLFGEVFKQNLFIDARLIQ